MCMPRTVKIGELLWGYFTYFCMSVMVGAERQKLEISDSRSLEAELGKFHFAQKKTRSAWDGFACEDY